MLTFRVSGKLWMRSLVMSDMETNTEWSHLLGRGMAGPLRGKTLKPLITDMVTWGSWRKDHPSTTVLDMSHTSREYSRDFYRDPSRFVFGFVIEGSTWALPMTQLLSKPVHTFDIGKRHLVATFDEQGVCTHLFAAEADGQPLDFIGVDETTMIDRQTESRWKISSGEAIGGPLAGKRLEHRVGIMSFRKAWQNFHPQSQDVAF